MTRNAPTPRIEVHTPDIPLERVERIAKLCNIPDELIPDMRIRLGSALMFHSLLRSLKPELTHKKKIDGLESLFCKAHALLTELEQSRVLDEVVHSYEIGFDDSQWDPKGVAKAMIRKTYEGVKRLAEETENALQIRQNGPLQRVLVKGSGEVMPLEDEDSSFLNGKWDRPTGIIVWAIFDIWEDLLGGKARIGPKSPFLKFAEAVFAELTGEKDLEFETLRARLRNPNYALLRSELGKMAKKKW